MMGIILKVFMSLKSSCSQVFHHICTPRQPSNLSYPLCRFNTHNLKRKKFHTANLGYNFISGSQSKMQKSQYSLKGKVNPNNLRDEFLIKDSSIFTSILSYPFEQSNDIVILQTTSITIISTAVRTKKGANDFFLK